MNITEQFISGPNRLGKPLLERKGVVIHWTSNTSVGAGARKHAGYVGRKGFRNSQGVMMEEDGDKQFVYGAAHFYVDDKDIMNYIPVNETAPHVGANKYTSLATGLFGNYPNGYLLGVETCVNPDSSFSTTIDRVAELAAHLLKEAGLGVNNLYRHYDITGKPCPAMMINEDIWAEESNGEGWSHLYYISWEDFKARVASYLDGVQPPNIQETPATDSYTPVDFSTLSIQRKLNTIGVKDYKGRTLSEDGIPGPSTESAIKKLQEIMNIAIDGQYGEESNRYYEALLTRPTLRMGMGIDPLFVRFIQYKTGASMDGQFGPNTNAKVIAFQKSKGLVADGIVGTKTWSMLFRS